AARGAGRAHVLVGIATRADDGRIAQTPGELPGQAARRGGARHLSLIVHRRNMNRSRGRKQDALNGFTPELRLDVELGGTLPQLPYPRVQILFFSRLGKRSRAWSLDGGLPVRVG